VEDAEAVVAEDSMLVAAWDHSADVASTVASKTSEVLEDLAVAVLSEVLVAFLLRDGLHPVVAQDLALPLQRVLWTAPPAPLIAAPLLIARLIAAPPKAARLNRALLNRAPPNRAPLNRAPLIAAPLNRAPL